MTSACGCSNGCGAASPNTSDSPNLCPEPIRVPMVAHRACSGTQETLLQLGTDMWSCWWGTALIQDWKATNQSIWWLLAPPRGTPAQTHSVEHQKGPCRELRPHQALWVRMPDFGYGEWAADGRHSLWAHFSTLGPAGQDWLCRSESGISRCYWCGTGVIHSPCCRCREIPQMASFFKTPLPKSFKTKLAISARIDLPSLLLIFAFSHYRFEEGERPLQANWLREGNNSQKSC